MSRGLTGAASVNLWLPHRAGYVMPAEMVETVNVTTTAGDAEQGMAGGAAITLVTKSAPTISTANPGR